MYRKKWHGHKNLKVNNSYIGETIEQKVNRITNNKEPITDGAPLIYTERNKGVGQEFDIRTDRWEVAIDAMDKVSKAELAKREARHKPKEETESEARGREAKEGMDKENVAKGPQGGV